MTIGFTGSIVRGIERENARNPPPQLKQLVDAFKEISSLLQFTEEIEPQMVYFSQPPTLDFNEDVTIDVCECADEHRRFENHGKLLYFICTKCEQQWILEKDE